MSAVEIKSQVNFLKGLNVTTGKTTVVPGSVVRNSNMVYTKRGSLETTDGTGLYVGGPTNPNTITWGADDLEILYIGTIPYGPGVLPIALVAQNQFPVDPVFNSGKRYGPYLYDLSVNPASNAGIGLNAPWAPSIVGQISPQVISVNNFAVFLFGNNFVPTYYDFYNNVPTTPPVTNRQLGSGSVLGAAHGIFHQNQVWLWNTYPVPFLNDGPSVLRASGFNAANAPDLTSFPVTNIAQIDPNDGQQGTGMISFTSSQFGIAPTSTLVLFKNFSTYQITGKFNDGSLTITRAQTDMGCVAPRSIQFVPGVGIVRLTHYGVAVFDGVNDQLISEEIRPYIFQEEADIMPLNWAAVSQCVACVTVNPPMYVLAIPVSGANIPSNLVPYQPLTRFLCYDLVLKSWNVIDLPVFGTANFMAIGYIATLRIPNVTPFTLLGDTPLCGPQQFTATPGASGGSLPNANYYLMVTALAPQFPGGESAPYAEQQVFVSGGGAGKITVTLPNGLIAGATGYRVYITNVNTGMENQFFQQNNANPLVITTLAGSTGGFPPNTLGVRRWAGGDETWDGVPIVWKFRTPDVFGKGPTSMLYFRRTVLRARTAATLISAKVTISGVQQARTQAKIPQILSGGSLYGSAKYGFATYGDAYPDLSTPYDTGITGSSANAEYSGIGKTEVLGVDWHFVPRPEGRVARVS